VATRPIALNFEVDLRFGDAEDLDAGEAENVVLSHAEELFWYLLRKLLHLRQPRPNIHIHAEIDPFTIC